MIDLSACGVMSAMNVPYSGPTVENSRGAFHHVSVADLFVAFLEPVACILFVSVNSCRIRKGSRMYLRVFWNLLQDAVCTPHAFGFLVVRFVTQKMIHEL